MLYQTYVSKYPSPASPGQEHNNSRHTSIYRTGFDLTEVTKPGQGLIVVEFYDHTRLSVEIPTAANAVAGAHVVLNHLQTYLPNRNYTKNYLGSTTSQTSFEYVEGEHLRLTERGIDYVLVDKAIDPANPVYLRVADGAGAFEKAGNFTDTADGADTVLITDAVWYGSDTLGYLQSLDSNLTQAYEADRSGIQDAYSIAPLQIVSRATVSA